MSDMARNLESAIATSLVRLDAMRYALANLKTFANLTEGEIIERLFSVPLIYGIYIDRESNLVGCETLRSPPDVEFIPDGTMMSALAVRDLDDARRWRLMLQPPAEPIEGKERRLRLAACDGVAV